MFIERIQEYLNNNGMKHLLYRVSIDWQMISLQTPTMRIGFNLRNFSSANLYVANYTSATFWHRNDNEIIERLEFTNDNDLEKNIDILINFIEKHLQHYDIEMAPMLK